MPTTQQFSLVSMALSSGLRAIKPGSCLTSRVRLPYPWALCGAAVRPATVHRREAGTGVSRGRSSRKEGPRPFPASCLGSSPWGLSAPVQVYKEVALAEVAVVVITAPDRLARKDLQQVLLGGECERHGVRVEGVERPRSTDPHDQLLLLQIRGAGAEYARTLITQRGRRGA